MSLIKIELLAPPVDGMDIKFKAPCDCSAITGLLLSYPEGSQEFTFRDSHGNNVAGIGNLFGAGAYVKVIVDIARGHAYLQNADNNGFLNSAILGTYTHDGDSLTGCGENGKFKATASGTISNITVNGVSCSVRCGEASSMDLIAGCWYTFILDGDTVNFNSAGAGGAGGTLTVTAPAGVTVTASKDDKTYTKTASADGVAIFKGLTSGTWAVTISDGSNAAVRSVDIVTDYGVVVSFSAIPDFTYTGDYEIVNDADESIETSDGNWKIRFLTSGTLTIHALNGAESGIDVFCVGGGGGGSHYSGDHGGAGGGGGYTTTERNISIEAKTDYEIVVGAGGEARAAGGSSSAFGVSANGGSGAVSSSLKGAAGGSGGGGGSNMGSSATGGTGGSDGSNGEAASASTGTNGKGGAGQGTTTREFAEDGATLYAGGGGGGRNGGGFSGGEGGGGDGGKTAQAGTTNTGGGGGGGGTPAAGGSGIVIIRNARG